MPRLNRAWALLLALCLAAGLSGCAGGAGRPGGQQGGGPEKPAEVQALRYNLGADILSLDPAMASGEPEYTALNALYEGLVRLDENQMCRPAAAASWEVSPDGTVYTFHLRPGARWSNGDPVTAEDFAWAWMRTLDPEFGDLSPFVYPLPLFCIRGARAYSTGKGPAGDVGLRVKDPATLEVTLEAPLPAFPWLATWPSFFPVHRPTVQADPAWAARAQTLVSNGPFRAVEWLGGGALRLGRNDHYWNRASVKLQELAFTEGRTPSLAVSTFLSGELDGTDARWMPGLQRFVADGRAAFAPLPATYYYFFNTLRPPLGDPRVRRALGLAVDRRSLVDRLPWVGQAPALGLVPSGLPDPATGKDFRTEGGDCLRDADVATARRLLEEAGFAGGAGFGTLELLHEAGEQYAAAAQAVEGMWRQNLGLTGVLRVSLKSRPYLQAREAGEFHACGAGWSTQLPDPLAFLEPWTRQSLENHSGWWHPDYEALLASAREAGTERARSEACHRAEELLLEEMPVVPLYFCTDPYLLQPYVRGVTRHGFGPALDFTGAYVLEHWTAGK